MDSRNLSKTAEKSSSSPHAAGVSVSREGGKMTEKAPNVLDGFRDTKIMNF
jgi:hypothetical protein